MGEGDGEQADEDQPGKIPGKVHEQDRNGAYSQQEKTSLDEL